MGSNFFTRTIFDFFTQIQQITTKNDVIKYLYEMLSSNEEWQVRITEDNLC